MSIKIFLYLHPLYVKSTQANYGPGVAYEESSDAGSKHLIVLNGTPWTQNSSFGLHARSMLNVLLKETSKYIKTIKLFIIK